MHGKDAGKKGIGNKRKGFGKVPRKTGHVPVLVAGKRSEHVPPRGASPSKPLIEVPQEGAMHVGDAHEAEPQDA